MTEQDKSPEPSVKDTDTSGNQNKKGKHHLIKIKWLRITLKTIMWIIIGVLIIPILIYIPPVQTFVKDIASGIVYKSTGMKVNIGQFRLKWPLDVSLKNVNVIEATGDTMVYAKEVIADVKLAPLFKLDVDVNELKLVDAGFRMLSPDSSLLLKIKAGELVVDDKSSVDIKTMDIDLNKVRLSDGNLSLVMDVWKKKDTPADTTTTPLRIGLKDVQLENFGFEMAMLPTIDTLTFKSQRIILRDGVVDLGKNLVTASYLGADTGQVTFLTPTPEYIASHPLPVDTLSAANSSPPMIIKGDTVSVTGFEALYAVADTNPLPGFDPSYIQVSDVNITLDGFLNEGASIKLPITRLEARERSGLQITSGSGTIALDSIGIKLDDVDLHTIYSSIYANASIPMALMEMKDNAIFNVGAKGSIGLPDVESFMPDVKTYTSLIPARSPLSFNIMANGSLEDIDLGNLDVSLQNIFSIHADGTLANVTDIKKLYADVDFNGNLSNPGVVDRIIGNKTIKLPDFTLKGHASADRENYGARFFLKTSMGDLAADGKVSLTSEKYEADVKVRDIDIANFLPDLGLGKVKAILSASGAGFNPTLPDAATDIHLDIKSIEYNHQLLTDITADATLKDGDYSLNISSANDALALKLNCDGTLAPDLYTFDLTAILQNVDLNELGITPEPNNGQGIITLTGNASPEKWLYDASLSLRGVEWTMGSQFYDFPGPIDLKFKSAVDYVAAALYANKTTLDFNSPTNLEHLIASFTNVADSAASQIKARDLNVDELQKALPPFTLNFNASGTQGTLADLLGGMGMSADTIYARISNDSIISANIAAIELANSSMRADTLSLSLSQRGSLIDYKAHMGNRRNNPLADFANVNVNGYLGSNRLMVGIWQKNQKGETGYRLGLTAAFMDSTVTMHFTPLKATIGYIPWQINDDNHIDVNLHNYRVDANLMAESKTSSILIQTRQNAKGSDELHMALDNIHIQDFLNLSVFAPPITADVNLDLNIGYMDNWLYGNGSLGISKFTYDKLKVGDFDLSFNAGINQGQGTAAKVGLKVNGDDALVARMRIAPDSVGKPQIKKMGLELTRFPLSIANAFLGQDVARLSGYLNGDFSMGGTLTHPLLNGYLSCDSVGVFIPMMGSSVRFNGDSITMANNVIDFHEFDIWGQNKNPLVISGTVDMQKFNDIQFDLNLNAKNFQLINNDQRARSDLYGKLFLDLDASARGPMEHFNINANVGVLSNTNVTYSIPQMAAQLSQHDANGLVRFVNFNDTALHTKADTIKPMMSMRIVAGLTLEPGMKVQVIYPGTTTTGNGKVEINPSGSLNYFQNYMGDMRLNGQINIGDGYARYSMPIVGEKKFTFDPDSYVHWNGDLLNPSLNIFATDNVKASIVENGNSRLVNFMVQLGVTNTLSAPHILFDLNTDDDLSIRNELMSMSADQRSMAALNMLLTGQYTGEGVRTASSDLLSGTMYNLLTSQINGWLANNVRGVDLSLGVDQYNTANNGESGTTTSYSYTVSKSLFNNRFKISVGGNYSTDASADENFSENLISDISFEYILKQTTNVTMFARLFRHTGYESILEGEITETGVGFMLKRRLANLRDLFRWGNSSILPASSPGIFAPSGNNRNNQKNDSVSPDTTKVNASAPLRETAPAPNDSTLNRHDDNAN